MSLWIGEALSPLERACIQSFLAGGHDFELYTYGPVSFIPEGCRLLDASAIVPADRIFAHRNGEGQGSVAAFSDLFRYELLYLHGGWWVDLDVFCLSATFPDQQVVIARQGPTVVNGAVLKFPPGHPLMRAARAACVVASEQSDWGEMGPDLLTRLVGELGMHSQVMSPESFYPVDWQHYWAVIDPRRTADVARRTQGATCIHLWNEMLRRIGIDKGVLPPDGSLLRALYESTIGLGEFTREYVLASGCAPDALQLEIRTRTSVPDRGGPADG
ncbi:MAG TPA: capsular polysaccharide synthesis protein [Povalibacter sp.]